MHDDARRWDDRYAGRPPATSHRPEALEQWPVVELLIPTSGRCLDIASGPGSVTLWLAARGLQVTALDASGVAIELLGVAATASELADRVDARTVDLDDGLPDDLCDLDLVVCQRFRDSLLYAPMIDSLGQGGIAIVTVLSSVGVDSPGPFHAPPGELTATFGAEERCEILHHHEGGGVAHIVVRRR